MDSGSIGLILLLAKSFYVLFLHLEEPRSVVFDEVHYGSLCNLYHRGEFHIDEQPPGAKMLLCFLLPRLGHSKIWREIGKVFPEDFPVWQARLLPAVFGFFLPVLVYRVVIGLKFSSFSAFIASFLVVFDNALTLQSKLLGPDAIVLFLQCLSLFFAIGPSLAYSFLSGVTVGLALGCSSSSFISWILVSSLCSIKAWNILTNPRLPFKCAIKNSCKHVACGLLLPFLIYSSIFYLHFFLLPSSGPHNHRLSSAFQASLLKGPQVYAKDVTYGSHVTLRSVSRGCFLTSSPKTFPPNYEDGRGSSQQQIVSCINQRESHNWWLVAPMKNSTEGLLRNKVENGADLMLIHSRTLRKLQANHVAAPLSPTKHEVSCYLHHPELKILPKWTVRITRSGEGSHWQSLHDRVQLYHNETKSMLSVTHLKLPTGQYEVVSDQLHANWAYDDSDWIVEEMFTNDFKDAIIDKWKNLIGFWGKMIEVHALMWSMSHSSTDHRFLSTPSSWPLAQSSIVYWYNSTTGAQIHLVGNPASWCAGVVAMVLYGILISIWAMSRQRKVDIVKKDVWKKNVFAFALLGSGWLLHMGWLTVADRPLFLYAYLPALMYKHMLHACVAGTLCDMGGKYIVFAYCILLLFIANTYERLLPLTLGHRLADENSLKNLQWWDSWEMMPVP